MRKRPILKVMAIPGGRWALRRGQRTIAITYTKPMAIVIGMGKAEAAKERLVVHKRNGEVQSRHRY
jgi:hypothetical protein